MINSILFQGISFRGGMNKKRKSATVHNTIESTTGEVYRISNSSHSMSRWLVLYPKKKWGCYNKTWEERGGEGETINRVEVPSLYSCLSLLLTTDTKRKKSVHPRWVFWKHPISHTKKLKKRNDLVTTTESTTQPEGVILHKVIARLTHGEVKYIKEEE